MIVIVMGLLTIYLVLCVNSICLSVDLSILLRDSRQW